jgi:hypothetical protein
LQSEFESPITKSCASWRYRGRRGSTRGLGASCKPPARRRVLIRPTGRRPHQRCSAPTPRSRRTTPGRDVARERPENQSQHSPRPIDLTDGELCSERPR